MNEPLWRPRKDRVDATNMTAFMRFVEGRVGGPVPDYGTLHAWSIYDVEAFWGAVWDFFQVRGDPGRRVLADGHLMPGARWFPDAQLNYAENLLARAGDRDALVFWGEDKVKRRLSGHELYAHVSRFAQGLRAVGVGKGDRVAGYMPNMPETIIAMLATASLGAVWSSASPDFGVQGAVDRFGQITPKVLVCADGYFYAGKQIDTLPRVRDIVAAVPTLERVVVCAYTRVEPPLAGIRGAVSYDAFLDAHPPTPIVYEQVAFDHPLFIMYSSGTTGLPKCIVHGHGGTLLQHLKEHGLHTDLKPTDRLFYFTTCGWMMWNWLASGLASGATLLLYDGSPFVRDGRIMFEYAEAERMTHFGTSAKFIDALSKTDVKPREDYDLSSVRSILSTGSPLAPESFDFVYSDIKHDVCLSSISGGTDIVSCFALGNPVLPVWRGEIQSRGLGLAVDVFDDRGHPVRETKGELVCTRPFPCMPIGFWNDPGDKRYRAAYFERFENVWCHGDFAEITAHDGIIIHGRSDAVLNPGGVRIGTAEIYRQVEKLPEVLESVVIGQDWPPGQEGDVRVVLFVKLRDDIALDASLIDRIKRQIRENTTPRHVPAKVVQVPDIPRTRSGKIVELAVRNVVHGKAVKNLEALANPEVLEHFKARTELGE